MIDDRLDRGEFLDNILDEYDPNVIAKSMIPEIVSKRTISHEKTSVNVWLIVLVLFSTPLLIPLGVVYLTFMIVVGSIMVAGIAVAGSGLFAVMLQIIGIISSGITFPNAMLSIGLVLIALIICLLVGYWLIKISWWLLQHLVMWMSQLIIRKKDKNEVV